MNKFKSFLLTLQAFRGMLRDKKAGKWPRIILIAALVYLILPFDLVTDFVPFFGLLDDAVLLLTGATALVKSFKRYKPSTVQE